MTGHSSSQDGPSDDAYSGDSPASDDEASANGCHLRGDGNFTRLEAYVADLPRDTFTSWPHSSWCNVQQRSENEYQAAIRLPPACAVRSSFRSSWCNSEVEAKDRAAQKALEFLRQRLDGPFQPMEIDEKVRWPFTPPSDGGPKVLRLRNMSEWGEVAFVYVLHATGEPMDRSYGFIGDLTSAELHPAFNYCFKCGDRQLDLRAKACSWQPGCVDIVQRFHCLATGRSGGPAAPLAIALLSHEHSESESGCVLNLRAMEEILESGEPFAGLPRWLLCDQQLDTLLWALERLRRFETLVLCFAPTIPAPNPMKLKVVFSEESVDADARQALSIAGAGALQFMAVLAAYTENPWNTVEQLKALAGDVIKEERLALLLVNSHLLDTCGRSVASQKEAATILEALVGAHLLEADFFSVAKLWEWLTGYNEFGPALLHLGGSRPFSGRTESYTELWEGEPEQLRKLITIPKSACVPGEEERADALLLVRYVDYDDAIYRRTGVCGEELRPDTQDARWERVVWDPNLGTYCSPSMKDSCGRRRPLANKVNAWLRGRAFGALVKIKKNGDTPDYTDIHESLDGVLHVLYKKYGVHKYFRRNGETIGVEQSSKDDAKEFQLLGFSEENKTLLSQSMEREPLPKKVVEWLYDMRSLAEITYIKKPEAVEHAVTTEADGTATWISNHVQYTCWKMPAKDGGVYVASVGGGKPTELSFSEVRKQWEVIVGEPWWKSSGEGYDSTWNWAAVPAAAIAWISEDFHELGWPARLAKAPWLNSPVNFLKCVPQEITRPLAEIEQALQHDFRNRQLLVEAITHGSVIQATTPSCERLAILGEAATQSYISAELVRMAQFPTAATATKDVPCQQAVAFAMPRELQIRNTQTKTAEWLMPPEPQASCENIESLRQRLLACCNHVSYAYSCVKLGLDKALHHNAAELKPAVKGFAKAVRGGATLEELIVRGAPKALGDIFLACIGAMVLDGPAWSRAHAKVLEKHMQFCASFKPTRPDLVQYRTPEDVEVHELLQFLNRAGNTIRSVSLAPLAPGQVGATDDQLLRALAFTDICVCTVDGEATGGVTPRTAELSFHHSGDVFEESEASSLSTQVDNADAPGSLSQFCTTCNMWLNGPSQWEDHRIGKKHLKNTRRNRQAGCAQAAKVAPATAGHTAVMTSPGMLAVMTTPGHDQSKNVKGKRRTHAQRRRTNGISCDAGKGKSRPAYLEIGHLQ